jgi:hypothetical protein
MTCGTPEGAVLAPQTKNAASIASSRANARVRVMPRIRTVALLAEEDFQHVAVLDDVRLALGAELAMLA